MRVLGIDACKLGWVGVELVDGEFAKAHLGAGLTEVIAAAGTVAAIGVDMPLGLLDRGWREADIAAAAFLGPRRASIFRVPPRGVLAEADFATATMRSVELAGGGISQQMWGLREKLHEANALWSDYPDLLYEVHPEVSFRAISGEPLPYPKTTWAGQALRRSLLAGAGVRLPDDLGPAGKAGPDDVLDAAAVGWSAQRLATGRAASLPDPPQTDTRGRPIAIWY